LLQYPKTLKTPWLSILLMVVSMILTRFFYDCQSQFTAIHHENWWEEEEEVAQIPAASWRLGEITVTKLRIEQLPSCGRWRQAPCSPDLVTI
jgi:hypothetical protein